MLSIKNLRVAYNQNEIIKDLTLSIQPGQTHLLMGPNGSGKSTLAYTLLGHPSYQITSGDILFEQKSLLALSTEKRARVGIFLVPQNSIAIPGVQVFTFLKEAHRMLVGSDIDVTDFKNLVYKAFDMVKLDHSFLYRYVHEGFSGGERKRFEIAQLLLFKPALAILDEIDSGLDIDALSLLGAALKMAQKENPHMSILIISHYSSLLKYIHVDVIHILKNGSIRLSGDRHLGEKIETLGYDGLFL